MSHRDGTDSTLADGAPSEEDSSGALSLDAPSYLDRAWNVLQGRPKNFRDPNIFHRISLIAFLAWVGLGADGLSSSAYGPDECFRALREHGNYTFLAVFLALATAFTVMVLSLSYSRIIEHFPSGRRRLRRGDQAARPPCRRGLGQRAARRLRTHHFRVHRLGRRRDLQHAAASACTASSWSSRSPRIMGLVLLNLRGVKESVTALLPVFLLFLVSHADSDRRGAHLALRAHRATSPRRCHDRPSPRRVDHRGCGGCSWCSSPPSPAAAAPTPASRRSPTACRSCASRASHTGKKTMLYMATLAGHHLRGHLALLPALRCPSRRKARP